MRENYYRIVRAMFIILKLILAILDEVTDIFYVIEVPFQSNTLWRTSIFFLCFSPIFQSISWAYIQGQIDIIKHSLDNKKGGYMYRKLELSNWADQSPNIISFYGRSFAFFLYELGYQIYYLVLNLPQGFLYGFLSKIKMLTVFFYFKMKDNNFVTAGYEDFFVRQLKNELEKVKLEILSKIRRGTNDHPSEFFNSQSPKNYMIGAQAQNGEETVKYSAAMVGGGSGYMNGLIFNQYSGAHNASSWAIDEMEYFEIMRVQGIIYFMTNEKIQKITDICEFIEFIFQSLPFLILQVINNEHLGWEVNSASLSFGAYFSFATSLISCIINTIHLLNFLVQKEGLFFLFMHNIFFNHSKELETYYSNCTGPLSHQHGSEIVRENLNQQQIHAQQQQIQIQQQQILQQQVMLMQQQLPQTNNACNNPQCYNYGTVNPIRGKQKSSLRMRSQLFLNGYNSEQELSNLFQPTQPTPPTNILTSYRQSNNFQIPALNLYGTPACSTIYNNQSNTLNQNSINFIIPTPRRSGFGVKSMTLDTLNFGSLKNITDQPNSNQLYPRSNLARGSHIARGSNISRGSQFQPIIIEPQAENNNFKSGNTIIELPTQNSKEDIVPQLDTVLETAHSKQQLQPQVLVSQQSSQNELKVGKLKLTKKKSMAQMDIEEGLMLKSASNHRKTIDDHALKPSKLRHNLSLNIPNPSIPDFVSPTKKVQLNLDVKIQELKPVQRPYLTRAVKSFNQLDEHNERQETEMSKLEHVIDLNSNQINELNSNVLVSSQRKPTQQFFASTMQLKSNNSDEKLSQKVEYYNQSKPEIQPTTLIMDDDNQQPLKGIDQISLFKNKINSRQSSADYNLNQISKNNNQYLKSSFGERQYVNDKDNTSFGNQTLISMNQNTYLSNKQHNASHSTSAYQTSPLKGNMKQLYQKKSLLDLVKIKKDISILKVYDPQKAEAISILKPNISEHIREITFSFPKQKNNSSDIIYYLNRTKIINLERLFLNLWKLKKIRLKYQFLNQFQPFQYQNIIKLMKNQRTFYKKSDCNIKFNDLYDILHNLLGERQKQSKLRTKRIGLIESQLQKLMVQQNGYRQIKTELQQFYLNIDENHSIKKDQNNVFKYISLTLKQFDTFQPTYFIIESPYIKKKRNLKKVYALVDKMRDSYEQAGEIAIPNELMQINGLQIK